MIVLKDDKHYTSVFTWLHLNIEVTSFDANLYILGLVQYFEYFSFIAVVWGAHRGGCTKNQTENPREGQKVTRSYSQVYCQWQHGGDEREVQFAATRDIDSCKTCQWSSLVMGWGQKIQLFAVSMVTTGAGSGLCVWVLRCTGYL